MRLISERFDLKKSEKEMSHFCGGHFQLRAPL